MAVFWAELSRSVSDPDFFPPLSSRRSRQTRLLISF